MNSERQGLAMMKQLEESKLSLLFVHGTMHLKNQYPPIDYKTASQFAMRT